MGLRVNKVMGYGLRDLANDGYQITDPRIKPGSAVLSYDFPPTADYAAWIDRHREEEEGFDTDLELSLLSRKPPPLLTDAVHYSGEYGLADVLVFTPLAMSDWHRRDDPIDWVEESYFREEKQANWVETLPHGFYPWNGLYMDTRTGERLPHQIMDWVRASGDSRSESWFLEHCAQSAGLEGHQEAKEVVAPVVPNDVRNMVRFLDVFTDPGDWRSLRPMLYTYWA